MGELKELLLYLSVFFPFFFASMHQIAGDIFDELFPVVHCQAIVPFETIIKEPGLARYTDWIPISQRLHVSDIPSKVETETTYTPDNKEELKSINRKIEDNMNKSLKCMKSMNRLGDWLLKCVADDGFNDESRYRGISSNKVSYEEHTHYMFLEANKFFYGRALKLVELKNELYPNSGRVLGLEALKEQFRVVDKKYSYEAFNEAYNEGLRDYKYPKR